MAMSGAGWTRCWLSMRTLWQRWRQGKVAVEAGARALVVAVVVVVQGVKVMASHEAGRLQA